MDFGRLNKIANYIEVWTGDGVVLSRILASKFEPTKYYAPGEKLPSVADSLSRAAELIANFADNNALVVQTAFYPLTPEPIPALAVGSDDYLLGNISRWEQLISGLLKIFLRIFDEVPLGDPAPSDTGDTLEWLSAVIAQRALVLASDLVEFLMKLPNGPPVGLKPVPIPGPATDITTALQVLEQQCHRIALDYLQMAAVMPSHVGPVPSRKKIS